MLLLHRTAWFSFRAVQLECRNVQNATKGRIHLLGIPDRFLRIRGEARNMVTRIHLGSCRCFGSHAIDQSWSDSDALAQLCYTRHLVPPNRPTRVRARLLRSHVPNVPFQTHTPKTLTPFDAKDGGRIFLTMNGVVFLGGYAFYGPGAHALQFFWG